MSDDLLPVVARPDQDAIARVVGGAGGIRFQWEELDRGVQVIQNAAERMREVMDGVGWMAVGVTRLQSCPAGVKVYAAGSRALDSVHAAQASVQAAEAELQETADRIRLSRVGYAMAELEVHLRFAALAPIQDLSDSVSSLPFLSSHLRVQKTGTSEVALSGTVEGLLARVSQVEGEPGSAFEVLEVEGESGLTYVVVLQGTEGSEWANAFSAVGVTEAEQADSLYVNDAVARGLEEAGAPEGANVVLVGYSQGGMHAMNLANSGPVQEKYSVSTVITAGSPTDDEAAPESTNYLHLKHELDAVPWADMQPKADARNQVTVVQDNPVFLLPGEDFGLGPAHKLRSYEAGARAVDDSAHPSIAPITAALGAAVVGSTAKRHVFSVTRPSLFPAPTPRRSAEVRKLGGRGVKDAKR
ncbi:pimeloyl-ACP methyl ester carboxylesterase [Arthrobacter pigmenti]|uniref:Pimeloyl-ACP methyl ester carboxylesterase n=1 Tax=Arthrobacter pigmenti TaxID=271432 RepID=A0A846RL19_9MICC|nr:pimeloyl-ACP methyl ester carboxylesterase [Arthrobacter pigmenti]